MKIRRRNLGGFGDPQQAEVDADSLAELLDQVAKVAANAGFKRLRVEGRALPESEQGVEIDLPAMTSRPLAGEATHSERGRLSALLGRLVEGVARRV